MIGRSHGNEPKSQRVAGAAKEDLKDLNWSHGEVKPLFWEDPQWMTNSKRRE
jgi:hypothetical protein